jgi:hypothetical protein
MNENLKYKVVWFGMASSIITYLIALKLIVKTNNINFMNEFSTISYILIGLAITSLCLSQVAEKFIKNKPFNAYMISLAFIESFCILGFVLSVYHGSSSLYNYFLSIGGGFMLLRFPKGI